MHIKLSFPDGGEQGRLLLELHQKGKRLEKMEVRGPPYSEWGSEHAEEDIVKIHGSLVRINVSELHADRAQTATPWHPEFEQLLTLFREQP
jgi:hypothetical protein